VKAKLRVCSCCEWIFKDSGNCPKCGFGHYGARRVYGDKCYQLAVTQERWLDKKLWAYRNKLLKEIEES